MRRKEEENQSEELVTAKSSAYVTVNQQDHARKRESKIAVHFGAEKEHRQWWDCAFEAVSTTN